MTTTTKQELIALAEKGNIYYKKSWSKKKIRESIEKQVFNDTLVKIKCKRSGIEFEVPISDAQKIKVHPLVREALANADRYLEIVTIIEKKKWESKEALLAALRDYYNPEINNIAEGYELSLSDTGHSAPSFRKAWVALLKGPDPKYGFAREFLSENKKDGRNRIFSLVEPGFYQAKEYSDVGNPYSYFFKIDEHGNKFEIEEEEIKRLIGWTEPTKNKVDLEACLKFKGLSGCAVGDVVKVNGVSKIIVKVESITRWEDNDGIRGEGEYQGDAGLVYEIHESNYWVR